MAAKFKKGALVRQPPVPIIKGSVVGFHIDGNGEIQYHVQTGEADFRYFSEDQIELDPDAKQPGVNGNNGEQS